MILRPPPAGTQVRHPGARQDQPTLAARRPTERQDWFWNVHSAAEAAAGAARWSSALATMRDRRARGLGRFAPATLDGIRAAYGREIETAARRP